MVIVSSRFLLPFSVFVPSLAQLCSNHFHLVDIVLIHVILGPLFELAELTSLHVDSAFAVHEDSLLDLLVVQFV
jgi:hypothetical protein